MFKTVVILICIVIGGYMLIKPTENSSEVQKAHHQKNGFTNLATDMQANASMPAIIYRYIKEQRVDALPTKTIPVEPLTMAQLNSLPSEKEVVIRLGHSSIYLQLATKKILIDPVFAQRTSPFSFIGPKRFHQPPIALDNINDIDLIIISHDHYDHLDKQTIQTLATKVKQFVVPLGVDQHLLDWGVAKDKITALDWWQSTQIDGLKVTSTPGQHFSGRGLFDNNKTLWSSYAIQSDKSNLFFSGDSGYFPGFKEIGERLGPFDLTMVETGAYDKDWPSIHMTPEQSLQAHLDVQGKIMLPIHNSTFDLAFHSWYEPLQRISELALAQQVTLATPIMGSIVDIHAMPENQTWWQQVKTEDTLIVEANAL